ncbi:MAG: GTP-binding protein [Promethearchaeota archaeon]
MGLLKKRRKKRKLRYIPAEFIYEHLYNSLKSFYEDICVSIKVIKRKYPKKEIVPPAKKLIYRSHYLPKQEVVPDAKKLIYRSHYWGHYDATYKVILFGDPGVERTNLTHRFLTNLFRSDSKMRIGIDFEVKSLDVDDKRIKLQVWDFGGEERFRFLLSTYVRGANGAIFIYDAAKYSSLIHIDDWLFVVRKEMKSEQDAFPIIVVGIIPELEEERLISGEVGIKIAKSRGVDGFAECNPRTGANVEETFEALTRLMLARSGISVSI